MTILALPIRRDEAAPGALLALHLCLSVGSIVVGKAARDAMFLSRYTPQQMTAMDIATMIAAALAIGAQMRLHAGAPARRLLLISPLCFALGDLGLWLGVSMTAGGAMTQAAYLWMGIQASFATPQASVLACHVFTLRQAKRLCGLVGVGATLGWIAGGLLSETLSAHFGAASLLLGSGALAALCPVVVSRLWRDGQAAPRAGPDRAMPPGSLQRSAATVWASPHLRAIAGLALVSSAVTTIVGLQFKDVASRTIGASDHLAAFFGSFSVHAGLVALATQVLLTSRILGSCGLGVALMIAPVALAAGSMGILLSGTLTAAVFLKGSDQVLRYSVDRAAVDLLYRPLSPGEILEGRTFIDALVCRLGDAMGGTVMLIGAVVLRLSGSWLSVICLALLLAWLMAARIARRRYREQLRRKLGLDGYVPGATPRRSGGNPPWRFGVRRARRDVMSGDPAVRLEALRRLGRAGARRRRPSVDRTRLSTALAAEMVGLAVLTETAAAGPSGGQRGEACEAVERIARLLHLMAPDRYPDSVRCALRSANPMTMAAAVEYLDASLPSPHRQLLTSLLDRWRPAV